MDDEVRDEEQKGGMAATDRRTLLRTVPGRRCGGGARGRDAWQVLARTGHRSAGADGHLDAQGSRQAMVAVEMGQG